MISGRSFFPYEYISFIFIVQIIEQMKHTLALLSVFDVASADLAAVAFAAAALLIA